MTLLTDFLSSIFNLIMTILLFVGIYYGARYGYHYYKNTYLPNSSGGTKAYTGGGACFLIPETVSIWMAKDSAGYAVTTSTNPGADEFFTNQSDCISWLNNGNISKVSVVNTPDVGPVHYHGDPSDFH
jgi:hypothetical protein